MRCNRCNVRFPYKFSVFFSSVHLPPISSFSFLYRVCGLSLSLSLSLSVAYLQNIFHQPSPYMQYVPRKIEMWRTECVRCGNATAAPLCSINPPRTSPANNGQAVTDVKNGGAPLKFSELAGVQSDKINEGGILAASGPENCAEDSSSNDEASSIADDLGNCSSCDAAPGKSNTLMQPCDFECGNVSHGSGSRCECIGSKPSCDSALTNSSPVGRIEGAVQRHEVEKNGTQGHFIDGADYESDDECELTVVEDCGSPESSQK